MSQGFSALVLSAGYGTRLSPLTDEIPKPLVPIRGRPLLGLTLQMLRDLGAVSLVVNTHHHAEKVRDFVLTLDFPVHVSHETRILGTAGGVRQAAPFLKSGKALVVNGDILGELPVAEVLASEHAGLTLAVVQRALGEGTVGLGEEGQVVRLRGQSFGLEVSGADYMGLALVGPECMAELPEEGCLIGDYALPHLRGGGRIAAVVVEADFEDIGTPSAYLEANVRELSQDAPGEISEGVQIEPGVHVRQCIIGAGATLKGEGRIERSVVLAGATATAPLSNCIVTPAGVVMRVGEELGSF